MGFLGLGVARSSWKGQSTGMDGRWIGHRDFRPTPRPKRHDDCDGASEMRLRQNTKKQRALARLKIHRMIV